MTHEQATNLSGQFAQSSNNPFVQALQTLGFPYDKDRSVLDVRADNDGRYIVTQESPDRKTPNGREIWRGLERTVEAASPEEALRGFKKQIIAEADHRRKRPEAYRSVHHVRPS